MTCTTASRLLAGHNEDDDAEALLTDRSSPEWALGALIEETESAMRIAHQLHQARPRVPAGALDEQIVYHCGALLQGASEICERLLRDLPDVVTEETAHADD